MGRLIRHADRRVALPVRTLPVPMIEPAFPTPLVAVVGSAVLSAPGCAAASRTAIALSAVAVRANPEQRLASLTATNAQPENHFSMNRHPPTQAGFDKGNGSCQGKTSFDGDLPMKVAQPEPRCLERRGSPPSKSPYTFSLECLMLMIGQMIAPSARMMLPGSYDRQKLKKLRFSMTDNTIRAFLTQHRRFIATICTVRPFLTCLWAPVKASVVCKETT